MLRRIVNVVILLPVGIVLIVLSVANRQTVTLALNPFRPADGVLALSAPLFVFLFAALIAGMVIGSFATWLGQSKYRRRARAGADEAVKWQGEAERQKSRAERMSAELMLPGGRS